MTTLTNALLPYQLAWPELFLALGCLVLLLVGAFSAPAVAATRVRYGAIAVLLGVLVLLAALPTATLIGASGFMKTAFEPLFQTSMLTQIGKAILVLLTLAWLGLTGPYWRLQKHDTFEFPLLALLSLLGMMVWLSAADFLTFYVGLELMSFCLYIMCAYQRDEPTSTEAGLKYFVLGAMASGLLLYGISLLYGAVGSTNFKAVALTVLTQPEAILPQLALGLVLVAMLFKLAVVPFHTWVGDVYTGAPTVVTAFLGSIAKLAVVLVSVRLVAEIFFTAGMPWRDLLLGLGLLSLVVGSLLALPQQNLKRLLAYSAIGQVGFILLGLGVFNSIGLQAVWFYAVTYAVASLGLLAWLSGLRHKDQAVVELHDLAGLARQHPWQGGALLVLLFSVAGLPPLVGFFAKFNVFVALVQAGHVVIAAVAVVLATLSAAYVLKILKALFLNQVEARPGLLPLGYAGWVLGGAAAFTLVFGLWPQPLYDLAILVISVSY